VLRICGGKATSTRCPPAASEEFQKYLDTNGKLKVVRTEALRAGFKDCWQRKDYTTIVHMRSEFLKR
jgi:hypothetical protein